MKLTREVRVVAQPPGLSARVEKLVLPDRASPEGFQHPLLAMKVAARMRAHFAQGSGEAGKAHLRQPRAVALPAACE